MGRKAANQKGTSQLRLSALILAPTVSTLRLIFLNCKTGLRFVRIQLVNNICKEFRIAPVI